MKTLSGPSSESASWIEKPPMPAIAKPPWSPAKKMRLATAVVVSVSAMIAPFASSLRMPPIRDASRSPPKSLPLTWTPSEAIPMIGNSPCASLPRSIWMPWIDPENSRPLIPLIPVTLAESVRMKFPGSVLMCGHWRPIASIRTGSQLGHLKLSPVAAPIANWTPKLSPAEKLPSPRNAKLDALPVIVRPPTVMLALAEPKLTSFCVAVAPVLTWKLDAVSVRNDPRLIESWSALNRNAFSPPPSNWNVAETASVPASGPSVIDPWTALPGRNCTPLEATVNWLVPPGPVLLNERPPDENVTPKFWILKVRSLKTSSPRKLMPPAGATEMLALPSVNPFE